MPPSAETSSKKNASTLIFYQFLASHSLLIGLFPFYIPVWLWRQSFSLQAICMFVAISGFGFALCLRVWESLAVRTRAASLYATSFIFELALVAFAACSSFFSPTLLLIGLALLNGLYNCFFWTTQRSLFLNRITSANSGRQYGNLQIVVTLFLKVGILCGGLLLQHAGMLSILLVSALLSLLLSIWFYRSENQPLLTAEHKPATAKALLRFRDRYGSRTVFLVDGLFLFLESHFWTLTLFIMSQQNFTRFGITVVALAVGFAFIFYLAKNSIDRIAINQVFKLAVLLYAAGWLIRPLLSDELTLSTSSILLIVATFCTSFFRLVFNKRFYDLAAIQGGQRYLLIKSYYTQAAVVVIYGIFAAVATLSDSWTTTLNSYYLLAAGLALLYLRYRSPDQPGREKISE